MQPLSEQVRAAKNGNITDEIKLVAKNEGKSVEFIKRNMANGRIVIFYDKKREIRPVGCGVGLKTKINVNVGTSTNECSPELEIKKALVAEKYEADRIMDLSTAGDMAAIRKQILAKCRLPVGIVTVYEACRRASEKHGSFVDASEDFFINILEEQIKSGINYITIHADLTYELLRKVLKSKRIIKIPARGGALLAGWMIQNKAENPYYKNFQYICEILGSQDVCLSLGNSVRAGSICDGLDPVEIEGIFVTSKLFEKAREIGVQAQIEAGSHIPLRKIDFFVKLVKSVCHQAPMGTLGPLVTDIGAGYDHIVQVIGQAVGVKAGLDYITAVTRSEHIGLPNINDIIEGLVGARLAVHAGMIARDDSFMISDRELSKARASMDWNAQLGLLFDPGAAEKIRKRYTHTNECSMCGDFCALKIVKNYESKSKVDDIN